MPLNKTNIAWTEYTCNPITGCSKISAGCKNCYAEEVAKNRLSYLSQYIDVVNSKGWTGEVRFDESVLKDLNNRNGKTIFMGSMCDMFHPKVKDEWLDKIFDAMIANPQHTYQLLTKRPERMEVYYKRLCDKLWGSSGRICPSPLEHIWWGTTAERQKEFNDNVHCLAYIPKNTFLSIEPLLDAIELRLDFWGSDIDWIIVGSESGNHRRPCRLEWVRSIVNQCKEAHVSVFVKQLNINGKVVDKIEDFPEDLQIREFPEGMEI